ncbi:MAG: hypothetical protein ACR2OZ_02720 [Verrucomicrobiales bacterium]
MYRRLTTAACCSLASFLSVAGAVALRGQDSFEAAETQAALKAALGQVKELQLQLEREREANRAITAQAAAANAEAKSARDELAQFRIRTEALGSGAIGEARELDKRLLDAVSDLRLAREETSRLSERLLRLTEAVTTFFKAPEAEKPALRQAIETELAAAGKVNEAPKEETASRIETSQVVSIQPEHKLVVINAGNRTALKVGTPLRLYRHDRPVANALVVEVRGKISGALVTSTTIADDFPKVGDSIRIDPTKN